MQEQKMKEDAESRKEWLQPTEQACTVYHDTNATLCSPSKCNVAFFVNLVMDFSLYLTLCGE